MRYDKSFTMYDKKKSCRITSLLQGMTVEIPQYIYFTKTAIWYFFFYNTSITNPQKIPQSCTKPVIFTYLCYYLLSWSQRGKDWRCDPIVTSLVTPGSRPPRMCLYLHERRHQDWNQNEQMLNSSLPSVAYMRQWIGSALFQIMACRLFSAKPLSKTRNCRSVIY